MKPGREVPGAALRRLHDLQCGCGQDDVTYVLADETEFNVVVATANEVWGNYILALRQKLTERFEMARKVLDEAGYDEVAVLVPVEEVLIWMDELGLIDKH